MISAISTEQKEILRRTLLQGFSDDDAVYFIAACSRLGLDPFAGHVHPLRRWDPVLDRCVLKPVVGIDGFRLVAERTGLYLGQQGPFWAGDDGRWCDVWLHPEPPRAAKVGILRKGFAEPLVGIAHFRSYCQVTREGKPQRAWAHMPEVMLAKCAEAIGLRRAFPNPFAGVYLSEELGSPDSVHSDESDTSMAGSGIQLAPRTRREAQQAGIAHLAAVMASHTIETPKDPTPM